ncbi:MAG: SH3 domain-containing protein [Polyangiaceae bacterium]|jgi:SH3-like domain-containing protein|nr:SH3 domain-containing protein [Polyangiaceae bacterium]
MPLSLTAALMSTVAWAEMRAVAVPTANFREGPSTQHDILFSADRYYPVEVLERVDGWVKTRDFEGDVAWVAEWLLVAQPSVVVKVPCAIVREGPSKDVPIAFKVERGEALERGKRQGEWLQVTDVDGRKGWVHQDVVWGEEKAP